MRLIRRVPTVVIVWVLLTLIAASLTTAQTFTAGVRGAVRESAEWFPERPCKLVNDATNAVRETVSNAVGEYDFSAVPAGTYHIRASTRRAFPPFRN